MLARKGLVLPAFLVVFSEFFGFGPAVPDAVVFGFLGGLGLGFGFAKPTEF